MVFWSCPIFVRLASVSDGAGAWAELVAGARRALSSNQAVAPLVGLVLLVLIIALADWKLAGWLARAWSRRAPSKADAGRRARPSR